MTSTAPQLPPTHLTLASVGLMHCSKRGLSVPHGVGYLSNTTPTFGPI